MVSVFDRDREVVTSNPGLKFRKSHFKINEKSDLKKLKQTFEHGTFYQKQMQFFAFYDPCKIWVRQPT